MQLPEFYIFVKPKRLPCLNHNFHNFCLKLFIQDTTKLNAGHVTVSLRKNSNKYPTVSEHILYMSSKALYYSCIINFYTI